MWSRERISLIVLMVVMNVAIVFVGVKTLYEPKYEEVSLATVETLMFDYVNDHRAKNGLQPLIKGTWLARGAKIRADEMAEHGDLRYVDQGGNAHKHTRPDGSDWDTALPDVYGTEAKPRFLSENIALTEVSKKDDAEYLAKRMFTQWKESHGHNEAMLNPDNKAFSFQISEMSRRVGSEYMKSDSRTYIGVQIFDTYESN